MSNRLAKETSPYLLQHAHNPVDWYPWGAEALARARNDNKPILLSIGYSACHWCHVMERESFEDETTARLMNELFVNVKVDREERPDIDSIYMQAVQAMTGHGGWPLTTFLTPELVPYWGGTYFPPTDRQGMPSFRRVLTAVSDAFRNKPDDVERVAQSMRQMYATTRDRARSSGTLSAELLDRAARGLLEQYDPVDGGFGDAPKFPQSMAMEFLLHQWARTGNEAALEAVRHSFRQMARGGIHDQIGGGFSRYSVDARWLVPHFEKMLYDNALLLRVGTHLLQATDDHDVRHELSLTCAAITRWLRDEMTSPAGGFYSAIDADSEGHEGKFYVWTDTELRELLGGLADDVLPFWGVSSDGNFEGSNILHVADARKRPRAERLAQAVDILSEARARRVRPARDDKILASWNGLMLRAMAEFAIADRNAQERKSLAQLALRNGEFLFREMVRDGRVLRSYKDGVSRISGFLEDYAAVGLGFLALYELTFDRVWLDRSRDLATSLVRWFWDDDAGAFFDTSSDHEELITRPRDVTDNATPSGTSLAIELLLRVGDVLGLPDLRRRALFALETLAEPMARYPLAFGHALVAADLAVHGAVEVAIVGELGDKDFEELRLVASEAFIPSRVLAGGLPLDASGVALLDNRQMRDGRATAYVCRNSVCDQPTTEPRELWEQIARATRPIAPP